MTLISAEREADAAVFEGGAETGFKELELVKTDWRTTAQTRVAEGLHAILNLTDDQVIHSTAPSGIRRRINGEWVTDTTLIKVDIVGEGTEGQGETRFVALEPSTHHDMLSARTAGRFLLGVQETDYLLEDIRWLHQD